MGQALPFFGYSYKIQTTNIEFAINVNRNRTKGDQPVAPTTKFVTKNILCPNFVMLAAVAL